MEKLKDAGAYALAVAFAAIYMPYLFLTFLWEYEDRSNEDT